jgi:uncharacterized protein (DUF1697 family)
MKSNQGKQKYVAFLRGINVGGHHKVPMAELRKELEGLNFENVLTMLNTGNILFDTNTGDGEQLERLISKHLEKTFGFPIPAILRTSKAISELIDLDPFKNITVTKEHRLYISFLRKDVNANFKIPWTSEDGSYQIISKLGNTIISVLDLSRSKTPKAMDALENFFGKDITTRNWNTIKRIAEKLEARA